MQVNELDKFYLAHDEPLQGCLLALKEIILAENTEIIPSLKYGMPFFSYKGKMFCYLWVHKKYKQPYIGFVEGKRLEHPLLQAEKRSRMKIMLFNPEVDLPLETIQEILGKALQLYNI
jgi:hypothetical protein